MAKKPQFKSAAWRIAGFAGTAVVWVLGFGGLFYLQGEVAGADTVNWFVIGLGVLAVVFFLVPGIVFPMRKTRVVKTVLPMGFVTWVRLHLYVPILAVGVAFVHATVVPFRGELTSGKILLGLGVLIVASGLIREQIDNFKRGGLKINVKIAELVADEPREFRTLVGDFIYNRRPLEEIRDRVEDLDRKQRELWREVEALEAQAERYLPREGGITTRLLHFRTWRRLHVPLTIALFAVLAWHVFDVLGGYQAVFGSEETKFASAGTCADCHSDIHDEWARSAMAHAQTSTIMEAQLPVTIGENERLARELGDEQEALFDVAAETCVNCHAPVGAKFTDDPRDLLPLDAANSGADGGVAVSGGNAAVNEDGVGCVTCHSQPHPLPELAGAGELPIEEKRAGRLGTVHGPELEDPEALPQRAHDITTGEDDVWSDPVRISAMCGECHNVKIDIDSDGLTPFPDAEADIFSEGAATDEDGDFQLDSNELDLGDDGGLDDLVLQTTFDEWQDYVVGFDAALAGQTDQPLDRPLGCIECHMPSEDQPLVDDAPGFLSNPDRFHRSHAFLGVDYDLDPDAYRKLGLSDDDIAEMLAEREAFLQSAVSMQVDVNFGEPINGQDVFIADVTIDNNFLGHAFPTGFAFARQAWLEVSAETVGGDEVCLINPNPAVPAGCSSGEIDDPDDDLPQCDTRAVEQALAGQEEPALLGVPVVPQLLDGEENFTFELADGRPVGECDPWLANFQKILTDGDTDGDGVLTEVPYQAIRPDIVKLRRRVATAQVMRPLETIRTDAEGNDLSSDTYQYAFDASRVPGGETPVVTATLHMRHLPPVFVRSLAERLENRDDIPDEARIDAEDLLDNMVVAELVTAASGEGRQVGCPGPQNGLDNDVRACVDENDLEEARSQVAAMDGLGYSVGELATAAAGQGLPAGDESRGLPGGPLGAFLFSLPAVALLGLLTLRRRSRAARVSG